MRKPYSPKIQMKLQEELAPILREFFCLIMKAREADPASIAEMYKETTPIDPLTFGEVAALCNLSIPLQLHTLIGDLVARLGLFKAKSPTTIMKINSNGLIRVLENTVFLHKITPNSGHYHLDTKVYPKTLGNGQCGFATIAQLFHYWQDNENVPEAALEGCSDKDKSQIQKYFRVIVNAGEQIVRESNKITPTSGSDDPKGPASPSPR